MRVGNLLDQPVSTQHQQFSTDSSAPTFAFDDISRSTPVEQPLKVSVAESVQVEFPPAHAQQEGIVFSQNAQPTDRSALPLRAPFQILRQLLQPSRVIHAGQCVRISLRRL